ncbi:hypothetical protein [Aureispira anguillae]|uniref:Uncharacterized protein n=1 Tax=Aureispira anguillae TaxID=2864201 RepID=A0A915YD14_9BACT|nr:hypothetical protein [Aureispira anguillae]BDS10838.1 hypothetical protein AsAng_0015480 [Aureispira anguillae]
MDKSIKIVEGTINIEAYIACPHCDTYIDLFEIDRLNDDMQLSKVIANEDNEEQDNYKEMITCPDCYKKIQIEGLAY